MTAEAHQGKNRPATARSLGGQTLYILVGNAFTLVVGFSLQIYVARMLGPSGLGVFGLIDAAIGTASGLLGFGIAQAVVRFVPAYLERGEFGNIRGLVRFGATILVGIGVAAYAVLLVSLPWIPVLWPALDSHKTALTVMGLMLPFGLLLYFLQQSLRAFQDIRYLVFGSSFLQLTIKALTTVSAFALGLRLEGYLLAIVASTGCALLWMGFGLLRKLRTLPHQTSDFLPKGEWRRFASTVYAMSLISAATGGLDRYLLGFFAGTAMVGVLVVVRQLRQMPEMFNTMLLTVGAPMFAAAHGRSDPAERQHLFVLMTDWTVRASFPLVVFLLVFASPLLSLYGQTFAEQGTVALWILVSAQFFSILCGPVGNVALMNGIESVNLRVSALSTISGVVLMATLAPQFGLLGIAIGSAVGLVITNGALLSSCRNRLGLHWRDRRYLKWIMPGAAALAIAMAFRFVGTTFGPVELGASLLLIYVTFAAVSLLQGLTEDDKELLRHVRDRLFGPPSRDVIGPA